MIIMLSLGCVVSFLMCANLGMMRLAWSISEVMRTKRSAADNVTSGLFAGGFQKPTLWIRMACCMASAASHALVTTPLLRDDVCPNQGGAAQCSDLWNRSMEQVGISRLAQDRYCVHDGCEIASNIDRLHRCSKVSSPDRREAWKQ